MAYLRITWILLAIFAFVGCGRTKSAQQLGEEAKVVVQPMGSKSGCQFLLVTPKGDHFIPVIIDNRLVLYPGSTLRIRYQILKEPVYACTSQGIPIQVLSGVEEASGKIPGTGGIKPEPSLCAWTNDPYDIPWMVQIIRQTDPEKITRFKWYEGGAYWFESKKGHYLFDCRGEFICSSTFEVQPQCLINEALSEPYVILVRNE